MTLDGVTKTEYTYTAQQGQGVRAQQSSFTNSVMTEAAKNAENTSVEENKNTSKLDELLEKLCAEFKNLGLSPKSLKNSGILYRITGLNEQQIQVLSEAELKQVMDCLKTAIKDCTSEGQINLEKVGATANKYYVALKTGWDSIEKYKRNQNGECLSERMERFFGLKEGSFAKLPQDKIEEYLDRYFNEFFVDKLKNAKTKEEKQQIYKQQLQDFGKLLLNTPDEDKAVFKQAITSLVASNRLKGLDAVLTSFATPKARTEWADSWSVEETKKLALKPDVEGNVLSSDEVTEAAVKLTSVKSEEGIKKHHAEFQKEAKAFFAEHKEALEVIAQKEAKGEELTEEEKQLKLERDNFYTAVSAGEISGTAMNVIIADAVKRELLQGMNKDAYELPNYKEVLEQVTEFVENNPEALTMPKEEIVKLLDEATNGNYSTVASGSDAELKAPQKEAARESAETPDYGFSQKEAPVDTTRLEALKQQFYTSENTTFRVERNEKTVSTPAAGGSRLQTKLEGMNSQEQLNYIAKNFHNFSFGVKNAIGTRLEQLGHNKLMRVLSQINSDSFILGIYKQLGLKQDDIEDLNVSTGAKKIMLNSLQREEKRA